MARPRFTGSTPGEIMPDAHSAADEGAIASGRSSWPPR
jgi:hypothetical protein